MNNDYQTGTGPKVLIVEDEQLVAMDVEMQLILFGCEVSGMADTGMDALHLTQMTQPDLILMDVSLSGPMDGIAVAAELQEKGIDTPIVFMTAYGSEEALRRARTVCASGYLTKPFRPEQLQDAVRSALQDQANSPTNPVSSSPLSTS